MAVNPLYCSNLIFTLNRLSRFLVFSGSVSAFWKVRIHIGSGVCVRMLFSTVVRFNCLTCSIGKFRFCSSFLSLWWCGVVLSESVCQCCSFLLLVCGILCFHR